MNTGLFRHIRRVVTHKNYFYSKSKKGKICRKERIYNDLKQINLGIAAILNDEINFLQRYKKLNLSQVYLDP